ncbi:uncharacterized protein LOC115599861 [Calypte anna]|uniref:uncharacterized protein LOC115599861 n=1 Tax=Calypte anna TaxID=9244 RepID=UPI0011C42934|nr:uncharacterized protein LOC115599861 [Calypte anna]
MGNGSLSVLRRLTLWWFGPPVPGEAGHPGTKRRAPAPVTESWRRPLAPYGTAASLSPASAAVGAGAAGTVGVNRGLEGHGVSGEVKAFVPGGAAGPGPSVSPAAAISGVAWPSREPVSPPGFIFMVSRSSGTCAEATTGIRSSAYAGCPAAGCPSASCGATAHEQHSRRETGGIMNEERCWARGRPLRGCGDVKRRGPRGSHECSHGTITVLLLMALSTTWLLREAEALLPLLLGSFPHTNITAQDRSPSACPGDLAPALLATSAPAPLPYCQFRREHGLHQTIKLKAKLKTRSLEAELQRALENAPLRF